MNNILWHFIQSIHQVELECGPRVMTHIYNIMDQIKGHIPLQTALENINNYNIDPTVFTSKSRQAQMILHTADYPSYQIQ